ncbi:MAG: hypothetical protein LBT50_05130, partial [Prevotellaceae bacterium]|nr:hypothetical protein [Prevotellaceae bacterium]
MNYKVFYILFFLLFFCRIDKIHADDEKTGQKKILELLGAAEKLSAVSNREALIFADSAMMLSQKINNVNY